MLHELPVPHAEGIEREHLIELARGCRWFLAESLVNDSHNVTLGGYDFKRIPLRRLWARGSSGAGSCRQVQEEILELFVVADLGIRRALHERRVMLLITRVGEGDT